MPKIVDVATKRAEILAAAAATFARHGYRDTNLARVAAAARMGKSSLYHYFPTRKALFAALVEETLQQEVSLFESADAPDLPAPAQLDMLIDRVTGFFEEWSKAGPLLVDFLREPHGRKRMRETLDAARGAVAGLIREGQRTGHFRRGSPDALATVVIGAVDGVFLQEIVARGSAGGAPTYRALREMMAAALQREGSS